jgi:branched-chain amino acid transport system substrate-binding protein
LVPAGLIALALALFVAACGGDDGDSGSSGGGGGGDGGASEPMKLRIGFSGDFSGPIAAYDLPLRKGMEFAAKQINAEGGDIEVEIEYRDNKTDQTTAIQGAQEMLDDGVNIQVLTTVDGMTAVGTLVTEAGGIVSSGMGTTPSIVEGSGERAWSVIFPDMTQAATAAQYACDQGYKTAYLVVAPEFDYTKYLPRYFEDAFAELCDGEIAGTSQYKLGQTDFGPQVTQIRNVNPKADVVYSPLFLPDTGPFLKRLRSAGVETPFIGGDGNDSKVFIESAGSASEGVVYTAHAAPTPGSPLDEFYGEFEELMGEETEAYAFEAVGRDTVYAYVEAARAAGSVEPDALFEEIMKFKSLELLTGTIESMDPETRYPVKKPNLVKIEAGERTFPEAVLPDYQPEPQYD